MYQCELCGRCYDKGELIQLSPYSALGCPVDGGECLYFPFETQQAESESTREIQQ